MINRKQRVVLAAQKIFLEKGFTFTSVQDILDEAEISKGTFYNYFSSKNECLIAILEHAQDEALIRRRELLIGKDKSDKTIFARQIVVRLQVNREQNLIPLLEAVFHSKDVQLREFAKKQYLAELVWISQRLVDIYGEVVHPYTSDCAVMVLGLIQQYNRVWSFHLETEIDANRLVNFILRRLDAIVSDMIHTRDKLLNSTFLYSKENVRKHNYTNQQIIAMLKEFITLMDDHDKAKQLVEFIISELSLKEPRVIVLESIVRSLHENITDSTIEFEGKELILRLYHQLNMLSK